LLFERALSSSTKQLGCQEKMLESPVKKRYSKTSAKTTRGTFTTPRRPQEIEKPGVKNSILQSDQCVP
jgi:hypothetical protein